MYQQMTEDRIKLFVGCAPNGEDAESMMVLEYTARKWSSLPIDITWMKISKDPNSFWSGWNTDFWSTPFSGFRWGIPAACEFKGQAIYMDSDMIIMHDLAELWNESFEPGKIVMSKGDWRFCVAKWNCAMTEEILFPINRLRTLPNSHQRTFNMFAQNEHLVQKFDRQWNNFDGENDNLKDIKILHYTDMGTQPHLKYALVRLSAAGQRHWFDGDFIKHRRQDVIDLFDCEYNLALSSNYKVENYVPAATEVIPYNKLSQKGYVAGNGFDVRRKE